MANPSPTTTVIRTAFSALLTAPLALAVSWLQDPGIASGPETSPQGAAALSTGDIDFARDVQPLLAATCFPCHGETKQKGDMRFDQLDPDMVGGGDAEGWHAALDMINGAEMPPRRATQFTDDERRLVVTWLTESLELAAEAQNASRAPVLRRLTKAQYTHSLQDLLGLDVDFGRLLPNDGKSEMGFSNSGEVLQASPLHVDYYQQIARAALDEALAVGQKPEVKHYRVTFGKGLGKGLVAGKTGGYQSVALSPDDFRVEILGPDGEVLEGEEYEAIQRKISVGLRGSSQERFRSVPEGMLLYSALPHVEKVPAAWQGPSPNLKLEMQRVFPRTGDFVMRVRASRGYLIPSHEPILVALEDASPVASYDQAAGKLQKEGNAIVATAVSSDERKNMRNEGDFLVPEELTEDSSARVKVHIPQEGYFQVDLVHPPVAAENMPSVRLGFQKLTLDSRPELSEEQLAMERVTSTLGAAYLPKGGRHLKVGGPFFTGFSHLILTPLPESHELVQRLNAETGQLEEKLASRNPSIRALVGTRTDDGMDYATFDGAQTVLAPLGSPETYTFTGRLENLPIPEPDSGDLEILSGFMLLGLWNDTLSKSASDPGPPLLVESIEFEAPFLPSWPPASHTAIFFDHESRGDEEAYAQLVLERFLERAYRRPVAKPETARYMDFWRSVRGDYATFEDGLREVMVAALCTPNFLFLAEPIDGSSVEGELPEYALASRLSYFLWNSPPDAELLELAGRGELRSAIDEQAERMLGDPRSRRFVDAFGAEWLRLDRHDAMTVNANRYPKLTRFVKRDMREETLSFLHHALLADLPVDVLVDSDFAMLNQNLAEYYGISGVVGADFRPVPVDPDLGRGGLLSQGAFLAGHSDGNQAHPIKRAVWIKEKLLGDPPPPPPPNVPDLDPDAPGFEKLTLKEQLEKHRDNPSCMDCHAGIDPYGIAFERYDAGGIIRDERKGRPVDDSSILPDGTKVTGVDGLKAYLLSSKRDQIAGSVASHLLAYALGRDLSFADDAEVESIVASMRASGYSLRSAVRAVVSSPSFTTSH